MNGASLIKYLFIAICAVELIAHFLDLPEINLYTKPLLMPLLLVYFRKSISTQSGSSVLPACWALFFSWIGDVSLMFQDFDDIYFLVGLSAFAIAQLLYIASFFKARDSAVKIDSIKKQVAYVVPFVFVAAAFLWNVIPPAGALGVPVLVYGLLLLSMVISAILRMDQTNEASFNQLFLGAALFMLSDSLIAWNKFLTPIEYSGLLIMFTYILAQWSLVNGLLKHFNKASVKL
jgi:uncharacterized membrane protein YhhN